MSCAVAQQLHPSSGMPVARTIFGIIILSALFADAGHAVPTPRDRTRQQASEIAHDDSERDGLWEQQSATSILARSERPNFWNVSLPHQLPSIMRFPDDDNSDDKSGGDPYAADPVSAAPHDKLAPAPTPVVRPSSAESKSGAKTPPAASTPAPEKSMDKPSHVGPASAADKPSEKIMPSANLREVRQQVNGTTPSAYIKLGTPEKQLYVILDTGSDKLVAKTWNTIQTLLKSVDGGLDGSIVPSDTVYNRASSTSYVQQIANASELARDTTASATKGPKRSFIAYGSGVAITEEGMDSVNLGGQKLEKFPLSEIVQDSLSMLHTKQGIAGILGLQHMKNRKIGESAFTRCRAEGKMFSFGYCRGDNNDGTFIWGDKATDGQQVDVVGQIHWAVQLGKVRMVNPSNRVSKSTPSTREKERVSHPDDIVVVKHGREAKRKSIGPEHPVPFEMGGAFPSAALSIEGSVYSYPTATSLQGMANVSSSLAETHGPDDDGVRGSESSLNDPEFKQEIGKIVGQIVDKVVDKIEHKKAGHTGAQDAIETESTTLCGENDRCTAIIDTGSNIIAGPTEGVKALASYARAKYDCSNFDELPQLHLNLGDFKVTLPPKAYIMQVKLPKGALGGERGDSMDDGSVGDATIGDGAVGDDMGNGDGGISSQDGSMRAMDGMTGFFEHGQKHAHKKVRAWYHVFRSLYRDYGVDLSAAMRSINLRDLVRGDKLCMPAFVPLDKSTSIGKLWVIGTPLFEQYYTRWSWAKDDSNPKIFLEDKKTAKACAGTPAQNITLSSSSQTLSKVSSHGLLRKEQKGGPLELLDEGSRSEHELRRPLVVDAFDLRYPHWAKVLSDV